MIRIVKSTALSLFVAAPFLVGTTALQAQTAAIVGYPANFDAFNNTGSPVKRF